MDKKLLKQIEDLKKRIAEQKEIIETLKKELYVNPEIHYFKDNRFERDGTSNYECPASKLW